MSADTPISPEALAPAIKTLLSKAKQFGADSADAMATHGRSLSVSVREGDLEDVDKSEGKDIGLRVMVGQCQACVSSSDFSNASLEALAERAVAMARLAPEDPYCGLADDDLLERNPSDLDMFDPKVISPEALKARALDIEKALTKGEKAFQPGLFAQANRGYLYIDEANLLEDHIVDLLLDVADKSAAMDVLVLDISSPTQPKIVDRQEDILINNFPFVIFFFSVV